MKNKIIAPFENDSREPADLYEEDTARTAKEGVSEPYAMPYFNKHSKTGVLLIHGFSATAHEMMNLTSLLEDHHHTVYSCLVAGHGVSIDYLNKKTYSDWYYSLQNGYNALRKSCDKIIVIGQSNGGMLAHLVAAYNKVGAVVLLAPAYKVRIKLFPSVKFFKYFIKYYPRSLSEKDKKYNYNGFALNGLYQMKLLQDFIKINAIKIDKPVQVIISDHDSLLDPTSVLETVDTLFTSTKKEKHLLSSAEYDIDHIVTEDKHRVVLDMVVAFLEKNV